jgi:hypothetical protein
MEWQETRGVTFLARGICRIEAENRREGETEKNPCKNFRAFCPRFSDSLLLRFSFYIVGVPLRD